MAQSRAGTASAAGINPTIPWIGIWIGAGRELAAVIPVGKDVWWDLLPWSSPEDFPGNSMVFPPPCPSGFAVLE